MTVSSPVRSNGASDHELLCGFALGDTESGQAFLRRFQGRVYGIALNLLGDRGLAEDVAQEAFVRAWKHAATYDPDRASVTAWLLRITRNLAIDTLRRRRPQILIPTGWPLLSPPVPPRWSKMLWWSPTWPPGRAWPWPDYRPGRPRRCGCRCSVAAPPKRSPIPRASRWARPNPESGRVCGPSEPGWEGGEGKGEGGEGKERGEGEGERGGGGGGGGKEGGRGGGRGRGGGKGGGGERRGGRRERGGEMRERRGGEGGREGGRGGGREGGGEGGEEEGVEEWRDEGWGEGAGEGDKRGGRRGGGRGGGEGGGGTSRRDGGCPRFRCGDPGHLIVGLVSAVGRCGHEEGGGGRRGERGGGGGRGGRGEGRSTPRAWVHGSGAGRIGGEGKGGRARREGEGGGERGDEEFKREKKKRISRRRGKKGDKKRKHRVVEPHDFDSPMVGSHPGGS